MNTADLLDRLLGLAGVSFAGSHDGMVRATGFPFVFTHRGADASDHECAGLMRTSSSRWYRKVDVIFASVISAAAMLVTPSTT